MSGEARCGLEFFADSLVGEVINSIEVASGGVELTFQSGVRALAKEVSRANLFGEKIVGWHMRPDAFRKIIVLLLDSGDEVFLYV